MTDREYEELLDFVQKKKGLISKNEGKLESLMHTLDEHYKCTTVDEAEEKLNSFKEVMHKIDKQIQEELNRLRTLVRE